MAERRRIIPNSVGQEFFHPEEKHYKPTRRFILTLSESNDKASPEFSYTRLIRDVGDIPDDEVNGKSFNELEEDDLTGLSKLARKFEEKYGPKKGKERRKKLEELIDVGLGYDDTDPFVDNSECYDELVPMELTTQFGGFYINSGELQFKELSGDSDDSDFEIFRRKRKNSKKKKKRALDSDEEKVGKKQKKRQLSGGQDTPRKKIKKKLQKQFGMEEKKKKKKKLNLGKTPTVAELLKSKGQSSIDVPVSSQVKHNSIKSLMNGTSDKGDETKVQGSDLSSADNFDPSLALDLGLAGVGDLNIDSDMAAVVSETLAGMVDDDVNMLTVSPSEDRDVLNVSPSQSGLDSNAVSTSEEHNLPADLKPELQSSIARIKEEAMKSVERKSKFFSPSVNNLLLLIENEARRVSCGTRSLIYNHLAHHLPCSKETLQKRAKKLRIGVQDNRLKEPIHRLREAISKVMPTQMEKFAEEYAAVEQARQSRTTFEEKGEESASQDEDDEKSKGSKQMLPRRKFEWTDHLRNLLCDVVSIKLGTFEMAKTRTQSAGDYLKAFLDAEIKPLWPYGWMQTRMLFKESRSAHSRLTSMPPKQKKIAPPPQKKTALKKSDVTENTTSSTIPESEAQTREASRTDISYSASNSVSTYLEPKYAGTLLSCSKSALPLEQQNSNIEESVQTFLDYASQGSTGATASRTQFDSELQVRSEGLDLLHDAVSEVVKDLEEQRDPSRNVPEISPSLGMISHENSSSVSVNKPGSSAKSLHSSFSIENISQSSANTGHRSLEKCNNTNVSSRIIQISPQSMEKKVITVHKIPPSSTKEMKMDSNLIMQTSSLQPVIKLTRSPKVEKLSLNPSKGSVIVQSDPSQSQPPSNKARTSQNKGRGEMTSESGSADSSMQMKYPVISSQNSQGLSKHSAKIHPQSLHDTMSRVPGLVRQTVPLTSPTLAQPQVGFAVNRVSPSRSSPSAHLQQSRVSPIVLSATSPNRKAVPISSAHVMHTDIAHAPPLVSPHLSPEGLQMSSSLPRRSSYPGPYQQVVTPPLTSPGGSIIDQRQFHSFQQVSPSEMSRKVSPIQGMPQIYPSAQAHGILSQRALVGQITSPEGEMVSPLPGMYLPISTRDDMYPLFHPISSSLHQSAMTSTFFQDPNYSSDASQGQPPIL